MRLLVKLNNLRVEKKIQLNFIKLKIKTILINLTLSKQNHSMRSKSLYLIATLMNLKTAPRDEH